MVALQTAKYDPLTPGSPGISVGGQQRRDVRKEERRGEERRGG